MFLLHTKTQPVYGELKLPGAAAIASLAWTRYRQAFGGQPSK